MSETPSDARTHLAWLMWCFDQGYSNAEDRAIISNWLLDDPETLHEDDVVTRLHLLEMADEILDALQRETTTPPAADPSARVEGGAS